MGNRLRKNSLAASRTLLLSRKGNTTKLPRRVSPTIHPTPWLSKVDSDKASRTRVPIRNMLPQTLPCRDSHRCSMYRAQYQQQHMIGKQSGPYQANFAQGHQQYHNPMTRVNANQYVSQHQFGPSDGSTGFSEIGHVHQAPYHQSSHYPEHLGHSLGEAGKDSGSRFVSGPWTSAPPSAGQL